MADALLAKPLPDDAILDDELLATLAAGVRSRLGRPFRGSVVVLLIEEDTVEFTALGCTCPDCLGPAYAALAELRQHPHTSTPIPH